MYSRWIRWSLQGAPNSSHCTIQVISLSANLLLKRFADNGPTWEQTDLATQRLHNVNGNDAVTSETQQHTEDYFSVLYKLFGFT